jgi:hypothetical protein
MMKLKSIALLAGILAAAACDKNAVQDITGTAPAAKIRFFNFALNAPQLTFFAGDTKLTATLSTVGTELPTGVAYGGVGLGGFYSGVEPGSILFTAKLSDTTTANRNVVVSSITQSIEAGKTYSYFTSGLYDVTTRKSDGFIVEDVYNNAIDLTQPYVRFVNAIYNSVPMILYAKNTTTGIEYPIGGAIPYKGAGAVVVIPGGIYDLSTRAAGSTTNIIVRTAVTFSFFRVYTVSARGDMTVTSTTATNRPFLDNTSNR